MSAPLMSPVAVTEPPEIVTVFSPLPKVTVPLAARSVTPDSAPPVSVAVPSVRDEIHELRLKAETYADISLLNVQVTQRMYGTGTIIAQDKNKVTVRFGDVEKVFVINKKFMARPTFEDDQEIVDAFTEYDDIMVKISMLESELKRVMA